MAVVNTISNKLKYSLMNKEVNFASDTFKMALMKSTYAFDKDTHHQWTTVSGDEITAGNGYTAGGKTMVSGTLTENDTSDQGIMTWLNNDFTSVGGPISDTGALIIYDDSHADKIVVGCSDFGIDYTLATGMTLRFTSIAFKLG